MRWLTLLCVAALPFEIVLSAVRNQLVLKVGLAGYLFHPAVGAIAGLLWFRGRTNSPAVLTWSLVLYGSGLIVSGVVNGSSPFYIGSVMILGPFLMVAVQSVDGRLFIQVAKAFVVGQAFWAACFLCFLAWNFSLMIEIEPEISRGSFGTMLLRARGDEDLWSLMLYFKLLGNFNKQANILAVSLILTAYLFVMCHLSRALWLLCTMTMAVMTLAIFSRGAFVVLLLATAGLVAVSYWSRQRRRQVAAAIGVCAASLISFTTPEWRDYWRNLSTIEQRKEMAASALDGSNPYLSNGHLASEERAGSTHASKALPSQRQTKAAPDLCEAKEPERSLTFFIFGYGLGNYGPTICRAPEAESHNGFVDAWIQGGVLSAIGYAAMFIVAVLVALGRLYRSRLSDADALFGLAIVTCIAVLAQREYALVYLWVQSTGGFLLAIGLALSCRVSDQVPPCEPSKH